MQRLYFGDPATHGAGSCLPATSAGNIGLPMPGTELALLDDDGNEVPMGTPGEIAIRRREAEDVIQRQRADGDDLLALRVFFSAGWYQASA